MPRRFPLPLLALLLAALPAPRAGAASVWRGPVTAPVTTHARIPRGLDGRPLAVSAAPSPTDTLPITATVPFGGIAGTGRAYVDLAPGHAALANPVIVVEGFDLDNSMGWNELYAELNAQNLLETLRGEGFDVVVLDFTDATDDIERNAFVFTTLLQQVEDAIDPSQTVAVAGASMGAVVVRYGLAWLETHHVSHRVRTWISFDGPHRGADIPIGLQYWVKFFASQSADAAYLAGILNRPAARELLLYHATSPATGTPAPDSARARFLTNLAAAGGFPQLPRSVAIANGSGLGHDQGFAPGAQLIRYEYNALFVQIRGDVWALPNPGPTNVFDGLIYVFLQGSTSQTVSASSALPYDGAPGGSRATMLQMDTTAVPYGDIVALHPSHCFVPTLSALDIPSTSLFAPIDAALRAQSPFDTVYVPAENQPHATVTAENAVWIRHELETGVLAAGSAPHAGLALGPAWPQPAREGVRIAFTLPRAGAAHLVLLDVAGREVARLADGELPAGAHAVRWDGRVAGGAPAPAGMYFARLQAGGQARTLRLVRLR